MQTSRVSLRLSSTQQCLPHQVQARSSLLRLPKSRGRIAQQCQTGSKDEQANQEGASSPQEVLTTGVTKTLSSLDSLLGTDLAPQQAEQGSDTSRGQNAGDQQQPEHLPPGVEELQRIPQADGSTRVRRAYDIPLAQPRWSYFFLLLNLAAYGLGIAVALLKDGETSNQFFLALAKTNDGVLAGQWYRLLSSTVLHAGLLHLGLNSLALYQIGPQAEALLGNNVFLAVYLLSGLSGSIASFATNDLVTVGASGSIFGLIGALAGFFLRNRSLSNSGRQLLNIASIVALNLFLGAASTSIDNAGHIGGGLAGLALGFGLGPRLTLGSDAKHDGVTGFTDDSKERGRVLDRLPQVQRTVFLCSFILSLALTFGLVLQSKGTAGGLSV